MRPGVAAAVVGNAVVAGDIEVVDGRLAAVGLPAGRGGLAVPGFVDLQVNGIGGVDFLDADPDGYASAAAALARTGVTAYQPTLITAPPQATADALGTIAQVQGSSGPHIVGAHLEGPFLSPEQPGTHTVGLLRAPDRRLLDRLLEGPVSMLTLAPELDGALDLIPVLVRRGVVVSLGHSDADAVTARRAFEAGATSVTHLFNAMRPFAHRDPGLAAAALIDDRVSIGIINDGVHLADETVRLAWSAAPDRIVLVTDAIAAAGVGDGTWRLGDVTVEVRDLEARRPDGVLAGSVLTMDAALRRAVDLGVGLVDAVVATSGRPARLVGRPDLGVLRIGGRADVAVLDDGLEVVATFIDGEPYP